VSRPINVQLKSSIPYWCKKLKSAPRVFMLVVKGQSSPQVTNKCSTLWPCIGPKAEKKDTIGLGKPIFATLGVNVPAFIY